MEGAFGLLLVLGAVGALALLVRPARHIGRHRPRASAAPGPDGASPAPAPSPGVAPSPAQARHALPPGPTATSERSHQPPPAPAPARTGRSALFAYGTLEDSPSRPHRGDYACIHLHTTGYAPARDRIIEIAVVRTDPDGGVTDTWTTLVDPRGAEVTGAALHGIDPGVLVGAPDFPLVASAVLTHLEEAVVVAHNAELVESFLAAAFLQAGVLAPTLPALPLSRLAVQALGTPNARLDTLARHAGRRRTVPSSAHQDALLVAATLPGVLARYGDHLAYPVEPLPSTAGRPHRRPALLPRPTVVGTTPTGWLADLLPTVTMSAAEANDPRLAAYVDGLTMLLPTGRIVADEVRELTHQAVRSGYRAEEIRLAQQRLLEALRVAAFAGGPLSSAQVRHLRAVAVSLGTAEYFDDLVPPPAPPAPTPGSGSFSRPVRKPPPPTPPRQLPRCGHCLTVGHYTAACPTLRGRGRSGGAVGPIRAVPGLGPIDPIRPI